MVQTPIRTFSDLDLDFKAHPITKDVPKKIGTDAIERSIRNLILTNFYDTPFTPDKGSGATRLLFENITPLTANFLRDQIIVTIQNYEPRAQLQNVTVLSDPENNSYQAQIVYIPLNQNLPVVATIILERIR